jgi:hypothetical protein
MADSRVAISWVATDPWENSDRGGKGARANLTKNQLVDNDDCVDDDKGYWIVDVLAIPSGHGVSSYKAEQCATFSILKTITQIQDARLPWLYWAAGVGKRTSHHGPHTGDQVDGLGFHACAIVCRAEARLGLCATPSDCMFQYSLGSYLRGVAGRDIPRARKRSSERTAMALMIRMMTGELGY